MKRTLLIFSLLISSIGFAQESIECQVLRQQIIQLSTAGDECQQMQRQCMALVMAGREQQHNCDIKVSSCRMGGAIGGLMGAKSELEQKIAQYKSFCRN
jgi:hypothetical protein